MTSPLKTQHRKALVTLNLGGGSLHPKSRQSFVEAARRWECDFVEIGDPIVPNVHPFYQKLVVNKLFWQPTHVLQLDADMVIRNDMPSPFTTDPAILHLTSASAGYGLANPPPPVQRAWRLSCQVWLDVLAEFDVVFEMPDVVQHYLNAGFLLYGSHDHTELFDDAWAAAEQAGFPTDRYPEQGLLSVLISNCGTSARWLPGIYNCTAWKRLGVDPMRAFIYHYAGQEKQERQARIDETDYSGPKGPMLTRRFLDHPPKDWCRPGIGSRRTR